MITTATLWVCSKCGYVDRLDGRAGSGLMSQFCSASFPQAGGPHSLKPVLVVVPYG